MRDEALRIAADVAKIPAFRSGGAAHVASDGFSNDPVHRMPFGTQVTVYVVISNGRFRYEEADRRICEPVRLGRAAKN